MCAVFSSAASANRTLTPLNDMRSLKVVMESLTTPAQPLPVMPPLTNTPRGLGCFQVLTVIVPPRVERQKPLTTVHVEQVEQQVPRDPDHARARLSWCMAASWRSRSSYWLSC